MITALQQSKVDAFVKLRQALQLVAECRSLICMGHTQRDHMAVASAGINAVLTVIAPSNEAPPRDDA